MLEILHSGTQINVGAGVTLALRHTNQYFAGLTSCTLTQKLVLVHGWDPALWYTN